MLTQEQIQAYAKKYGVEVQSQEQKFKTPLAQKLASAFSAPQQEEQSTFGKVVNTAADFTGGKYLAQGIGKAIAKPMVEERAAQETLTAKDKMNAMVSELDSAFKQGRTEDVKRLQEAIRAEIDSSYLGSQGSKTLTDFQSTVPTNRQIVGSTLQLAATAIPAGKLASGGGTLMKSAELASKGATTASGLLAKTAIGAGTGYTFDIANKLQNNEIDIEKAFTPGLGTAIGASIPLLGWGISKVASKNQSLAKAEINSLIKPKKTDLAYGKDPANAILREKITGKTLDEVGQKVDDAITTRVAEASEKAKKITARVDLRDAVSSIDDAMATAAKQNNQAAVTRLKNVKDAITQNLELGADGSIVSKGARNLSDLSVEDALRLKREVGSIGAWTGNPSDDKLINKAVKGVFGSIKGKVEKVAPELTDDIEHISSLLGAKHSISNRIDTLARQNLVGFTDKVVGTAGVLGSIMMANPLPVLAGLGEIAVNRLLSSPSFKTRFAQWLVNAPKSQVIQLVQEVPWTKALLVAGSGIKNQ